jgi:serine/threonine protein kinase
MVAELAGGSLIDTIQKNKQGLCEHDVVVIIHKILSVLNYCHKKNIFHRDIRPENILMSGNDDY